MARARWAPLWCAVQGLLQCANPLDYAIGVWYTRELVLQAVKDNPACGILTEGSGCLTAAEAFGVRVVGTSARTGHAARLCPPPPPN